MSTEKPSKSKPERQADLNFIAPLSLEECQEQLSELREPLPSWFGQLWLVKVDFSQQDKDDIKFRIRKIADLRAYTWNINLIKGNITLDLSGFLKRRDASSTYIGGNWKLDGAWVFLMFFPIAGVFLFMLYGVFAMAFYHGIIAGLVCLAPSLFPLWVLLWFAKVTQAERLKLLRDIRYVLSKKGARPIDHQNVHRKPQKSKHARQPDLNFIAPFSLDGCRQRLERTEERGFLLPSWYFKVEFTVIDEQKIQFRATQNYRRIHLSLIGVLRKKDELSTHVMGRIEQNLKRQERLFRWLGIIVPGVVATLMFRNIACGFLALIASLPAVISMQMRTQTGSGELIEKLETVLAKEDGKPLDDPSDYFNEDAGVRKRLKFYNLEEDDY